MRPDGVFIRVHRLMTTKVRCPRLSSRQLIVAVAIAALPLAVHHRLESRRVRFERLSSYHYSRIPLDSSAGPQSHPGLGGDPATEHRRAVDRWHARLGAKYYGASQLPWLPVEPDPPEPR